MQEKIKHAAAHVRAKRFAEAERCCIDIARTSPKEVDSNAVLAAVVAEVNDPPSAADFCFFLAVNNHELGRIDQARIAYETVLSLNPVHVHAWANRSSLLRKQGLNDLALHSLLRALQIAPDMAGLHLNLGNLLAELGRSKQAIEVYRKALALLTDEKRVTDVPLYGSICANLGRTVLVSGGELDEAIFWLREALRADSNNCDTLNVMGTALCHAGRFDEGAVQFKHILVQKPQDKEALNNFGSALGSSGAPEEARVALERAIELYPDYADAHTNLAMLLLRQGDFQAGFAKYEWRHRQIQPLPQHQFEEPQWNGEDISGKTLLIHAEQGLGDSIQFCRYASLVTQRGITVNLEVPPELVRLFRCLPGIARVIGQGEKIPVFDFHCPMVSLPLAFGTSLTTVPAVVPYLWVPPDILANWQTKMPRADNRINVGLVWAGNPRASLYDHAALARRRAVPPELLLSLTANPLARFFSLQINAGRDAQRLGLIDLMPDVRDFADTAALVAQLDLVITVDTSVAHLAGAMGKPVWMMDRSDGCWRWLYGKNTSPWYPSMRIFRQEKAGDWSTVVSNIKNSLDDWVLGQINKTSHPSRSTA